MLNFREIPKILIQDVIIISVFLLISCGIGKAEALIGNTSLFIAFAITWPILFIFLFYSNAGLLKHIDNDYIWSLGSGIPSILITAGTVMFATHNMCGSNYVG